MLLAPLAAAGLSADATFEFKPLSRALLDQGCSLEPGVFELAEVSTPADLWRASWWETA